MPSAQAMIQKYKDLLEEHPESPQYQYLYALAPGICRHAQINHFAENSHREISGLRAAARRAGNDLCLGNTSDRLKVRKELDSFFEECPNSLDSGAWGLVEDSATPEIAAQYAMRLRERLTGETDRDHLQMWRAVWDLEFKAVPASQHERVREQLARDLAKLEGVPGSADVNWLAFLKSGYTMLDNQAALDRVNNEILREFPRSRAAKRVLDQRWWKAHPEPLPGDSEEKKQATYKAQLQMFEEQLRTWPDDILLSKERFEVATKIEGISREQIGTAADALLAGVKKNPDWSYVQLEIARAFVEENARRRCACAGRARLNVL